MPSHWVLRGVGWEHCGVAVDPPTPTRCRPSAEERERTVARLRAGLDEERLSLDTYAARLEGAHLARSQAELEELLGDLPGRRRGVRPLRAMVGAVSVLGWRVERAWADARAPPMALPSSAVTLGRSRDCDCVLSDLTVSRRHARIEVRDEAWFLRDLRSSNGTLLNGCRVLEEVRIHPGDRVTFGAMTYRLGHPMQR
jgi:FHA domain/DUF1707 SHOCT-like domain